MRRFAKWTVVVVLLLVLFVAVPAAVLWSLNVIGIADAPFTPQTWFATLLLIVLCCGGGSNAVRSYQRELKAAAERRALDAKLSRLEAWCKVLEGARVR